MASLPPQQCCTEGHKKEGDIVGQHVEKYGIDTYATGAPSKKIVVILTDIFGNKFPNNMLVADRFAAAGYYTLIPDLFAGDAIKLSEFSFDMFPAWMSNHPAEDIKSTVDGFLSALKKDTDYEFLGVVGHCFGGKYAIHQLAEGKYATCGAVAHPSFTTIEEVKSIATPILISAAETDPAFTVELRHETEKTLKEMGAVYQLDLFSGTEHGYAIRGDESIPAVKYAKEKTLQDQIYWFNYWASQK